MTTKALIRSIINDNENLAFVHLEQAGRAILLAFFCNIPIALWGAPGIGKSSKVYQIVAMLYVPLLEVPLRCGQKQGDQYKMYDFRLSDKEKSDIGGIPYPVMPIIEVPRPEDLHDIVGETPKQTKKRVMPYVEYLIAQGLLPFDTDEYCILFLDEVDRTDDPAVRNAIQQVILDRRINGHILSPNCRIVLAGNGTSDIDTSQLSKAANGRMVHIYVENESEGALASWQDWGSTEVEHPEFGTITNASEMLRAFAKSHHNTWINGSSGEATKLADQAEPTNRTWIYADWFIRSQEFVDFKTRDIIKPLVAGCVGLSAATELLVHADTYQAMPTIEAVVADPEHVDLPASIDAYYAATFALTNAATKDHLTSEAVGTYALRWPEEAASVLFRRLLEVTKGSAATTKPYLEWSRKRGKSTPSAAFPEYVNHLPELVTIFTGSIPRIENDQNINRLEIPSKSVAGKGYILSQERATLHWRCACPGWVNGHAQGRTCEHIKRIPDHMRVAGDPNYPDKI